MSRMIPVPWHDVATKDDLRVLSAELRSEMADMRTELRGEMAELRIEMHQGFAAQTRWLMGYVTALSAIMLAVARLIF